jgi:hypothetical protein
MPFALNPAMLIVVIAVFEMPLGIPGTARHGSYRQHVPTLTLFEFAMQLPSCLAVLIAESMQKPTVAEPRTQSVRVAVSTARMRKRHFG